MTVFALLFSIVIAAASQAWGFYSAGLVSFSIWVLIFGALWLFAVRQNWDWFSSVGLLFAVFAAAFGLFLNFPPGWMFSGALFALFAWDMNDFRARMRLVGKNESIRNMERRHVARVTILSLVGLALASAPMFFLHAKFSLEWAALLVLIVLLGLTQLVGWFRKQ